MNHECELHGVEWLVAMVLIFIAMLACMLAHIVINRITIGRWWT